MKHLGVRSLNRCMGIAVFAVLAFVIASGGVGLAQGSGDRRPVTNRLTGTYRLNQARSDNPATTADRVTRISPVGTSNASAMP